MLRQAGILIYAKYQSCRDELQTSWRSERGLPTEENFLPESSSACPRLVAGMLVAPSVYIVIPNFFFPIHSSILASAFDCANEEQWWLFTLCSRHSTHLFEAWKNPLYL
jgi:hypothetical protein